MIFPKKTLAILSLFAFSNFAIGGLVHTDWKVDGDKLATLDEETGIEWLKITQTTG